MKSTTYNKGQVSIITPCYNGAHLIPRLLDSVLAQDYPTVEMFVVDDGSTDNLKEVVDGYVSRFEAHGYTLHCLHQEHQGQSAALNLGLKQAKGEYLLWPDSDDYFTPPTPFQPLWRLSVASPTILRSCAVFRVLWTSTQSNRSAGTYPSTLVSGSLTTFSSGAISTSFR